MRFRIKTARGYYYLQAGKYGRFDGSSLYARVLCEAHARRQVEGLNSVAPGLEAEVERFPGHAPCADCAREAK